MSEQGNELGATAGFVLPSQQDLADMWRVIRNIRINSQTGVMSAAGLNFELHFAPTPFLGWIDPDNANKIIYGTDRTEAFYPWLDTIFVSGTALTLNKAAAETIAITEDCDVYYAINVNAGPPITAVLGVTVPVPDDTDDLRHVVLGRAKWDGSKVDWYKQQQFGNIHVLPSLKECDCPTELNDLSDVEIT